MSATVFNYTIASALKETLDTIVDDPSDGYEQSAQFTMWMDVGPMDDEYVDDVGVAGPGLISEVEQGVEYPTGTIVEHGKKRYRARKFGMRILVTEEAIEDNKYEKILDVPRKLKRSLWKSADFDATLHLVRATDTAYTGGLDGLSLANASHTLGLGGTYSNTMTTPMSPSVAALQVAVTAINKYPDQSGVIDMYEAEQILCPLDQQFVWKGITKSTMSPEAGNFAEINTIKDLNLKVLPLRFWNNTTTNWAVQAKVDAGFRFLWRVRPKGKSYGDDDADVIKYKIRARWDSGWTDPRCIQFVDA